MPKQIKPTEYNAKIVFVCASTLNSAWILMNSATDIWPDGLGSSSGELGHNLMDHHLGVGAGGEVEGYEDKYYYGLPSEWILHSPLPELLWR